MVLFIVKVFRIVLLFCVYFLFEKLVIIGLGKYSVIFRVIFRC